ncbi:MAG: NAD-dependent epimerase/dehydratase family protein, partial [Saprospiraceae bacterium]
MPATPPAERPLLFVTGATGNLGRYLLPALRATGRYHLRLLYRPESGKDRVQGDDLEWVAGDLHDQYVLEESLVGCTACVHAAALVAVQAGRRTARALQRTNVEGTENVVNACLAAGVKRLVYLSSVAALDRDRTGEPVDETSYRSDPKNATTAYARSKVLAEREVWRGRAEGLSTAILYPSVILGEGDWDGGGPPGLWRRLDEVGRYYPAGGTGLVAAADVA